MQHDYFAFIASAYAISAVALIGLAAWIFRDARVRRSELAALEKSGLRRRSGRSAGR